MSDYKSFGESMMRKMAQTLGASYEDVTKELEAAEYSRAHEHRSVPIYISPALMKELKRLAALGDVRAQAWLTVVAISQPVNT